MSDREGFLDRWSRRKLAEKTRAEEEDLAAAPTDPDDEAAIAEPEAEAQERHPAEEIDIDALTPESDYSVFLQKGVSAATRRLALRKLWSSNPLYAGKELLSDNFDLTDAKTWGLGPIRDTAWKVGQGYGPLTKKVALGDSETAPEPDPDPEGEPERTGSERIAPADSAGEDTPPDETARAAPLSADRATDEDAS